MRVKLIRDCYSPNPGFDPAKANAARRGGPEYDEPQQLLRTPGEEISHPDAWRLCVPGHLNAPPVAVPADDEARAAYQAAMQRKRLAIQELDLLIKNKRPADKAEAQHLAALRQAYLKDLQALDPDYYADKPKAGK